MKTKEELQAALDEHVNTLLGAHRGRVDVVSIESHPDDEGLRVALVRMSGGCQGCAGAKATMRSIVANCLSQVDPTLADVHDVTDHSDKTNAFFKE